VSSALYKKGAHFQLGSLLFIEFTKDEDNKQPKARD